MNPVGNLGSVRVFSIWITSMNPVGNLGSVRVFPSILMSLCLRIVWTSLADKAYFRRFLMNKVIGREAFCLWGPELGLMVKAPPSLSHIHDLGAAKRFRCFLGPRGILTFYFSCRSESSNISLV